MLFVIPRGFEPRTHSLEGCCSIQLSYETITFETKKSVFLFATAKLIKIFELNKYF